VAGLGQKRVETKCYYAWACEQVKTTTCGLVAGTGPWCQGVAMK